MSLIVLCSATGAPGVTTTTLALGWVWPLVHPDRRVLVVDADAAGSGLLPGLIASGVPAGGGVLALAAERSALTPDAVLEHALTLDPSTQRMILTGITDPTQARVLSPLWTALVELVPDLELGGVDVLVDLGRLGHRYEPKVLVEGADVVAIAVRSSLASVAGATSALRSLRQVRGPGATTTVVSVGQGHPYTAREMGRELGIDDLQVVALDAWAAETLLAGGAAGWRFDRSPLFRSVQSMAPTLASHAGSLRPVVRP